MSETGRLYSARWSRSEDDPLGTFRLIVRDSPNVDLYDFDVEDRTRLRKHKYRRPEEARRGADREHMDGDTYTGLVLRFEHRRELVHGIPNTAPQHVPQHVAEYLLEEADVSEVRA